MAEWIGIVLRVGVFTSAALVLIGLGLGLLFGRGDPGSLDAALGKHVDIETLAPGSVLRGVAHFQGPAFIRLGIFVLILTPIARVALTLIFFARQRDRLFILLAGVVLIVLLLGLAGIGA